MESRESALAKAGTVAAEMESRKLKAAAGCLREGIGETTAYLLPEFPTEHRRRIRTNNMIERLNREIRRCFASMFVRQVRQCFSAVWADGFPRCRHRFPVM